MLSYRYYVVVQRRDERGATTSASEHPTAPSSHPLSSSKPSEVMAAVTSRFEGREDELNAEVAHYNIKASQSNVDGGAGAPDK